MPRILNEKKDIFIFLKPKQTTMRRSIPMLAVVILVVLSCNKSIKNEAAPETKIAAAGTGRSCASYEVLQQQLKEDPSLAQRMESIERFTRNFENGVNTGKILPDGTLEVPVVVNVLWNNPSENISDAQINSQLRVLNQDFSGSNHDINFTPAVFQPFLSGNTGIKFVLQKVVRKYTSQTTWSTNNAMKKSNQGGIDATSPSTTLNIWVCTMGGGILGYAQFPGGNEKTDGVVILNTAFGNMGTVEAPYDKGRTATHEIGHYFNLRHIWGDRTCGDDQVDDTPIHTSYNFGCPDFPANSSCGGTVHPMMTMNYMDYTDDACMYMFTAGQKTRMQATYAPGGPRASLR